jgi:hypothetical protein
MQVMELIAKLAGSRGGGRENADVTIMLPPVGHRPSDSRIIDSVGVEPNGTISIWAAPSTQVEPYQGAWEGR